MYDFVSYILRSRGDKYVNQIYVIFVYMFAVVCCGVGFAVLYTNKICCYSKT